MAIVYVDGFDECGTTVADVVLWGWLSSSGMSLQTTGRVAGNCLRVGTTSCQRNVTANTRMTVGFAWRAGNAAISTTVLSLLEASTEHVRLAYNGDGTFTVSRAGTALAGGTTANLGIVSNTWYYIELDAPINDTTGAFQLWVDNTSRVSGTGLDTRNGGAVGTVSRVGLVGNGTATGDFDDLYIADGTSSAQGDCRVITKLPTGDGASSQWTCSTGTTHYALVDENPNNGDTDYVSDATAGDRDTYTFPALGVTGTVKAVQPGYVARKDDAGTRTVAPVIRRSATNYDGTGQNLSTSYAGFFQVYEQDPSTAAAWTVGNIDAGEFGIKLVA